jgi:hypothetical protein
MTTKKSIIVKLSTLIFAFNTDIAMAADTDSSSMFFPGWPIALLVIVVILFRKKLFVEAGVQAPEAEHKDTPVSKKDPTPAPAKPKAAAKAKPKTTAKTKVPTTKTSTVNLITDGKQCQASTAKGSQCKRTTTLEKSSVIIKGTKYQLTVCSQHNNDAIKPFSGLIS